MHGGTKSQQVQALAPTIKSSDKHGGDTMKTWQYPDPFLQALSSSQTILQAHGVYTGTATYSGATAPLYTPSLPAH